MEKSRVRPLWLLVFLLIPLLLFVPLLFRNNVSVAASGANSEVLRWWIPHIAYNSIWLLPCGVAIAFFAWVKRRIEMRAFPWLVTFLTAHWIISVVGTQVLHWLVAAKIANSMTNGLTFAIYWDPAVNQLVAAAVAALLLIVLIASDLLFLLRRLGIEADNLPLRVLARAREYSTPLGVLMLVMQAVPFFYLAYLYFR